MINSSEVRNGETIENVVRDAGKFLQKKKESFNGDDNWKVVTFADP